MVNVLRCTYPSQAVLKVSTTPCARSSAGGRSCLFSYGFVCLGRAEAPDNSAATATTRLITAMATVTMQFLRQSL